MRFLSITGRPRLVGLVSAISSRERARGCFRNKKEKERGGGRRGSLSAGDLDGRVCLHMRTSAEGKLELEIEWFVG